MLFFRVLFSNYNNSSNNQAISGSKSSFSSSTGISSSSQLNSSSDPSSSLKEFSNSSHHISSRVKCERSESPVVGAHNFASSAAQLYKLSNNVPYQIQTKAALKAISPNSSVVAGAASAAAAAAAALHGQVSAMHNNSNNNNVIQPSPISISLLENQVAYSDSNKCHSASNSVGHSAASVRKLSSTPLPKQAPEYRHDSASTSSSSSSSSIPNPNANTNDGSHIVIPRRPSPHQISSQPSPLGTVPSPAYPMYNSPMNPSQSPIDASTSRTSSSKSNNQVAYSSVIQRTAVSNWDGTAPMQSQTQAQSIYNQTPAQITKLHQISPVQSVCDLQPTNQFSGSSQLASNPNANANSNHNQNHNHSHSHNSLEAVQKMTDSVHHTQSHTTTAFIPNQQRQRQTLPNEPIKKDEPPKSRPGRKKKFPFDRAESEKLPSTPSPSTSSECYTNERIPPPAHVPSNQQSNGSPNYNFNSFHNSTMISHPSIPSHASHHYHHAHPHPHHPTHAISHPYFPPFSMPLGVSDYPTTTDLNLNSVSMVANIPCNDSIGTPSVSSNYSPTTSEIREDEPPKVIVPNIEEELGFLAENNRSGSSIQQPSSAQIQHQSNVTAATASTPNHLTLLGATSNAPQSHQSQSNHQHTTHMQHSSHTNQNANNSQSSSSNQMSQQQKTPLTDKKFPTPTGPGSGFMASYLKFLQGERDTSPPPVNRGGGGRKTWSRTTNQSAAQVSPSQPPANVNQTTNAKNQMSNGMNVHSSVMSGGVYDRKRTAPVADDDDSTDSMNNKQQPSNKNSKKQPHQSVVERAPQVPINAAKKGRAAQSNSFLSSQQTTQQNNPIGLQQNPQLLMQQHLGQQQILGQQQMYYPQDEGSASSFSSYFDYLRRQKW